VADVSPGGKTVGRVNIRVLPDTSKFKDDLDRKLRLIEPKVRFTVNVDRAKLDRVKIRADIERQFAGLTDVSVDVDAKAIVTKADVRRVEVRKDLQRQFDEMGLKVKVGVDLFQAERDIEDFVDKANRQQGSININAATAAATAQMRFLSRDRYVTLIPEISKTALAKVEAQLLALSGIRVAGNWAEDIIDAVGRIDKNLPMIGILTSSITTLISVLLASVSGILGLGAGLASIVPTLLILPGLLIGTGFAITTLVVAMKVGKKELDALADPMNELASIIQETYWDAARDPIVSLITTLMPQLRVAFGETAAAMGRFTGAFAEAFENELSEGRLMPLFDGISRSFDILATGADAFAGAIVSLSAIAAKYVPRLAQWFVDISIDFDNWLNDVANDGRMDQWFETGIDAIQDTGRAINGMARQFAALWKAAEAGGSGGLVGFADAMQRYAEVMESSKFQSTMTAIFRGASDGTKSLADGLSGLGNMFHYLEDELTFFLGGMGKIIGVFLEDFADAFSSSEAKKGLTDFTQGLVDGFAGFGDFMEPIADGISALATFAGALAANLGPLLGATLAGLASALTPVLNFFTESVLPWLGPALTGYITLLGDALTNLFEVIFPAFQKWWGEYVKTPFEEFINDWGPTLVAAWDAIIEVVQTFVDVALPVLQTALIWISDFVRENVQPVLEKLGDWFADPENKATIERIGIAISVLVGIFLLVPLAVAAVIAILILVIAWIVDTGINLDNFNRDATKGMNDFARDVRNYWGQAANSVIDAINEIIKAYNRLPLGDIGLLGRIAWEFEGGSGREFGQQVPGAFAGASVVSRGNVLVGEQGPEILNLGKGASVIPLDRIGLNSGGSGNTLVYNAAPNMSIDAEEALFTAMRRAKVIGW
jgi:hypothetical protein